MLDRDLQDLTLEGGTFIQYVDDLLICSPSQPQAIQHATQVLNFLAEWGYKASKSKAQLAQQQVSYLGTILTPGRCSLSADGIKAISDLQTPTTRKQLRAFLGLTGYCRIWIPNYGLIAQSLYEALKDRDDQIPLEWGPSQQKTIETLKSLLCRAPPLELPNPSKPFQLYTQENGGVALRVLTQKLGETPQPIFLNSWIPLLRAGLPVLGH